MAVVYDGNIVELIIIIDRLCTQPYANDFELLIEFKKSRSKLIHLYHKTTHHLMRLKQYLHAIIYENYAIHGRIMTSYCKDYNDDLWKLFNRTQEIDSQIPYLSEKF
jgi:hypothetical protein